MIMKRLTKHPCRSGFSSPEVQEKAENCEEPPISAFFNLPHNHLNDLLSFTFAHQSPC